MLDRFLPYTLIEILWKDSSLNRSSVFSANVVLPLLPFNVLPLLPPNRCHTYIAQNAHTFAT